jgi:hypothetical protein
MAGIKETAVGGLLLLIDKARAKEKTYI